MRTTLLFPAPVFAAAGGDAHAQVMAIEPIIVKRACPGFLAVAPQFSVINFAVEGRTEDEARENFYAARARWAELTAMP